MKYIKKNNYEYSNKKVMRKVKKNWVVLSIVTVGLLGTGAYVQSNVINVHADSVSGTQLQTGKWGDANVTLNSDGVLTVSSGDNVAKLGTFPFDKSKVNKIVFLNTVKLPSVSGRLLGDFNNLTEFVGLDKVDASQLSIASGLFVEDHNLQSIDVSSWKTPNLTNAYEMFAGDHRVTDINVTGLDTSNVTDMSEMFAHDYNLTNLVGVNTFNTEKVTNLNYFLGWATSLKGIDLSNFKTPNLSSMVYMFINTPQLTSVNIANLDTRNINGVSQAFAFIPGSNDDGYPYNDKQDLIKSNLQSIITGPNYDPSKVQFDSAVGNVNLYKLNEDGTLSLTGEPSKDWGAAVVKIINGNVNGQPLSLSVAAQGVVNSPISVPVPAGYGVLNEGDNVVNLKQGDIGQIQVKVYKQVKGTINLVDQDNGSTVVSKDFNVLDTQSVNVRELLPTGYLLLNDKESTLVPTDGDQSYRVLIAKETTSQSSSSSSSAESSSATSTEHSSAESSSATSAEPSSAQSSSATSTEHISAESSSATSTEHSSAESSSATSTEHSSAQSSSVTSLESSSAQSSSVTNLESSSAQSSSATSAEHSSAESSSATSTEHISAQSSSVTSLESSSAQSSSVTSLESSSAQSSSVTNLESSSAQSSSATSAEHSSAQSSSATSTEHSSAQSSSATSAELSSVESSSATSTEHSSAQSSIATSSVAKVPSSNKNNAAIPVKTVGKDSKKATNQKLNDKKMNVDKTQKDKLPQTGDEGTKAYQAIGLLILISSFVLALFRRKRNEK
ncbi:BspA family leucine-rich repeat surface protein [Apilactobacillus kunkeei]|uniref:Putative cell-wall-anchored protein (LPXTG motif) n=1 Tax=Apilactobacillus kunkeei TaxID=148814 RepID=A0A0M9DGF9_9LACO|nr:BspA family leucine-rich repeat surface protein [Apilactobacillus kunkeei]KOY79676.1 putative cell-wall-anchored protein (LPXTG motif) [Apilactobacillus kunkeei]